MSGTGCGDHRLRPVRSASGRCAGPPPTVGSGKSMSSARSARNIRAGVVEQRRDRRVELRRVVEQTARLVEQLESFVLLALADVGPVGEEDDRRRDRQEERRTRVTPQMTMIASRARLVLAIATMLLNRSISGSLVNCGAPPEREMTVATSTAPRAPSPRSHANAAIHSRGPARTAGVAIAWKTAAPRSRRSELGDVVGALDPGLVPVEQERGAGPDHAGQHVLAGRQEEQARGRRAARSARRNGARAGSGRRRRSSRRGRTRPRRAARG